MREIILLRHGESVCNKENRFTGWTDVDLSSKGIEEVKKAAGLLNNDGITFDVAFTGARRDLIPERRRLSWLNKLAGLVG